VVGVVFGVLVVDARPNIKPMLHIPTTYKDFAKCQAQ